MHLGPRHYLLAWLGLLALTALSFGLSYVQLGAWSTPVALVIAAVKAVLVAGFFMHLVAARFAYQLALVVAAAFILLLLSLTVVDVVSREVPPAAPPIFGPGGPFEHVEQQ